MFFPALFGGPAAQVGTPSTDIVSTFTANAASSSDLTEYTFSAQAIGTAAAGRHVLVGISARSATTLTVSTVTIGGVSASEVGTFEPETGTRLAFWVANVPTGTTADIVVTFSGAGILRCGIGVWALTNLQSTTATDSGGQTTAVGNATWTVTGIDVSAGGAAYAVLYNQDSNGVAWSELTERYDALLETTNKYSGASKDYAAAQTNLSIAATISSSGAAATGGIYVVALR